MIIAKLTVLIVMATFVYGFLWTIWLEKNKEEYYRFHYEKEYMPKGAWAMGILGILSVVGSFASVIYLLFFR